MTGESRVYKESIQPPQYGKELKACFMSKFQNANLLFLKKTDMKVIRLLDTDKVLTDGSEEYMVYISEKRNGNSEMDEWIEKNSGNLTMTDSRRPADNIAASGSTARGECSSIELSWIP